MSESPFSDLAGVRDITVRKRGDSWFVGCSDCWLFAFADNWPTAMRAANMHAATKHTEDQP